MHLPAVSKALQRGAFTGLFTVLFAGSAAHAVIVVDSGVDQQSRQYRIDPGSAVTFNPGPFAAGELPTTVTMTGTFQVAFERHWWTYRLDGDAAGDQGTFVFESQWARFTDAVIVAGVGHGAFEFPGYPVMVNGQQLAGDNSACSMPLGPNDFCTGFNAGPVAALAGQVTLSGLVLNGTQPTPDAGLFSNYAYTVVASAVPEPASVLSWLLGLAAGGLVAVGRRRRHRSPAVVSVPA